MNAYPLRDGTFYIRGDRETYSYRERLKNVGARWNGQNWYLSQEQVEKVGAHKMVYVETESCHERPQIEMVREQDAIVGKRIDVFCGLCDSHSHRTIVRVG